MKTEILAKDVDDKLYDLVGYDDFFDRVYDYGDEDDVRMLAAETVSEWLEEPDNFCEPWEPEAIAICEKAIEEYFKSSH